jgi:hypothetical protein
MVISYKGNLGLCCSDYFFQAGTGNLMESTLLELWNRPGMTRARRNLLANDRSGMICEGCDYPGIPSEFTFSDLTGQIHEMKLLYPREDA